MAAPASNKPISRIAACLMREREREKGLSMVGLSAEKQWRDRLKDKGKSGEREKGKKMETKKIKKKKKLVMDLDCPMVLVLRY